MEALLLLCAGLLMMVQSVEHNRQRKLLEEHTALLKEVLEGQSNICLYINSRTSDGWDYKLIME